MLLHQVCNGVFGYLDFIIHIDFKFAIPYCHPKVSEHSLYHLLDSLIFIFHLEAKNINICTRICSSKLRRNVCLISNRLSILVVIITISHLLFALASMSTKRSSSLKILVTLCSTSTHNDSADWRQQIISSFSKAE